VTGVTDLPRETPNASLNLTFSEISQLLNPITNLPENVNSASPASFLGKKIMAPEKAMDSGP
jgi:hypothetical protein